MRRWGRAVIGAVLLTSLALTGLSWTLHADRSVGAARPSASARVPGPVLLVPGYGNRTAALKVLRARLVAEGRRASIVALPGDNTGDLHRAAAALDRAVQRSRAAGATSVDIVGFSAGGVIARLWVRDYSGAREARRIVTIGSPHAGVGLAHLTAPWAPRGCPAACRQLAAGSALLTGLGPAPAGPEWTSIWSRTDGLVPNASSRLSGSLGIRVQDICGDDTAKHGMLAADPLVQGLVLRALARQPLEHIPGPGSCATLRAGAVRG